MGVHIRYEWLFELWVLLRSLLDKCLPFIFNFLAILFLGLLVLQDVEVLGILIIQCFVKGLVVDLLQNSL